MQISNKLKKIVAPLLVVIGALGQAGCASNRITADNFQETERNFIIFGSKERKFNEDAARAEVFSRGAENPNPVVSQRARDIVCQRDAGDVARERLLARDRWAEVAGERTQYACPTPAATEPATGARRPAQRPAARVTPGA